MQTLLIKTPKPKGLHRGLAKVNGTNKTFKSHHHRHYYSEAVLQKGMQHLDTNYDSDFYVMMCLAVFL